MNRFKRYLLDNHCPHFYTNDPAKLKQYKDEARVATVYLYTFVIVFLCVMYITLLEQESNFIVSLLASVIITSVTTFCLTPIVLLISSVLKSLGFMR